ncbi:WNT5B [Cordylochernes scorpioides]|uniref:WNT5B n=1 Tax=Cordylochernes scorpioides TaxID=51811 RepID=A0ABY6LNI8_9ARAC|nr:WNT5B [Cordylochernes scorpioides]
MDTIKKNWKCEKLLKYFGPYTLSGKLSEVNYLVTPKDEPDIDPHVVHISRMKPYFQRIQVDHEDVVEPEGEGDLSTRELSEVPRGWSVTLALLQWHLEQEKDLKSWRYDDGILGKRMVCDIGAANMEICFARVIAFADDVTFVVWSSNIYDLQYNITKCLVKIKAWREKVGQSPSSIFKLLQNLNITRQFVYRTIERFNKAGTIDDLERSGRPRVQRTEAAIKAIRERIRRNPRRKQKILAKQINLAPRTVSRIINEDLGLRAFKRRTGHLITPALRDIRKVRSKMLLTRHDGRWHERILFTDGKIFTAEE